MLQMDFSLQKKSKIPKSYKSHRTKLLSSDQLQLKERNKTKSHKKPQTNQWKKTTHTKKPQAPQNPQNHLFWRLYLNQYNLCH